MRAALALCAALAPAAAAACPVCARDGAPDTALLVGAMIAAPYVVTLVVLRAIRGGGEP